MSKHWDGFLSCCNSFSLLLFLVIFILFVNPFLCIFSFYLFHIIHFPVWQLQHLTSLEFHYYHFCLSHASFFVFFILYISGLFPVCKLCLSIFTIFTFIYFEIHPFSCLIIFLYSNLKFTLIHFSVQLSSHLILITFFCTFSSILWVCRFMAIHHDNYHFIFIYFHI